MNFKNIDTKLTIYPPGSLEIDSYKNVFFFHMITTGHFWRNSKITELSLLYQKEGEQWQVYKWSLEQEADEYDMLTAFSDKIRDAYCLIGFNSSSFHIPYLTHKYKAYGLENPFEHKMHIDLLKELKPIGKQLHISTKLSDLRLFLQLPDFYEEIQCIGSFTSLFLYPKILQGEFQVIKTECLDQEVLFKCKTGQPFPKELRLHDKDFYLIGSENDLKIKVRSEQGQLKLYYPNYKDYYFIPEENTVIHRSLAEVISKDRKRKALPEECFSYFSCSQSFLEDTEKQRKYLLALLGYFFR